jgi:hypothetical protein
MASADRDYQRMHRDYMGDPGGGGRFGSVRGKNYRPYSAAEMDAALGAAAGKQQAEQAAKSLMDMHKGTFINWPDHMATSAIAGRIGQGVAAGLSGLKGAKKMLGDQYWKSVDTNIKENVRKQHANWAERHKAHINTWTAELKNLTKDLDAAYAQKKRASARPESDKKRQSKIDSADTAIERAHAAMDRWLVKYNNDPLAAAEAMFADFTLGGIGAADKLKKVEQAAADAIASLENKYAAKTATALNDAQKNLKAAVKAAMAKGWKAENLKNIREYQ